MSELFPKKRLPAEYDEVEYLESTGSQWIDLGMSVGSDNLISFDINLFPNVGDESVIFGGISPDASFSSGNSFSLRTYSHKWYWFATGNWTGFGYGKPQFPEGSLGRHILKWNGLNEQPTVDGIGFGRSTWYRVTPTVNAYLFATNYGGVPEANGHVSIYRFEIEGIMKLIPALRKSDNKPGMYDLVSGQFFVNQGTGDDFLYGAIVPYPEEISLGGKEVACIKAPILPQEYQQVEYLDDHGGQQYIEVEPTDSFIPCYRKSDNKPGLYDLANSRKNLFNKDEEVSGIGHVKPNTQYTFSFTKEAAIRTTIIEVLRDGSEVQIWTESSSGELGPKAITFTTSADTDYIRTNSKGFPNAQLEEGSAATDYEPYPFYVNQGTGEFGVGDDIPMYGRWNQMIRLSNYTDMWANGVTYSTNSLTGEIVLNGTMITSDYTAIPLLGLSVQNIANHIIYVKAFDTDEDAAMVYLQDGSGGAIVTTAKGTLKRVPVTSYGLYQRIYFRYGVTYNNFKCRPQFFDLTKMFGAGNEPSTIEEFESWCSARGIDLNEYQPYDAGSLRVFKDYPDGQKVWEKESDED